MRGLLVGYSCIDTVMKIRFCRCMCMCVILGKTGMCTREREIERALNMNEQQVHASLVSSSTNRKQNRSKQFICRTSEIGD